ncbi:MAG: hypothetical protein HQL31_02255 [Planctomycetes bacterium]|nr:hypothetical protein [Planctomycetota bacterium]
MKSPFASLNIPIYRIALCGLAFALLLPPSGGAEPSVGAGGNISPCYDLKSLPGFCRALEGIGCSVADIGLDENEMLLRGQAFFTLNIFKAWVGDPLRIPKRQAYLRQQLSRAGCASAEVLSLAAMLLDAPSCRSLIPPTPWDRYQEVSDLAEVVSRLHQVLAELDRRSVLPISRTGSPRTLLQIGLNHRDLPKCVEQALARILAAVTDACIWRDQAFHNADPEAMEIMCGELFENGGTGRDIIEGYAFEQDSILSRVERRLAFQIEFRQMYAGYIDLADVVDHVVAELSMELARGNVPDFHVRMPTLLGEIILSKGADDDYADAAEALLILDMSGNDRYTGGAASRDFAHPFGLIIDLAGDDTYTCGDRPGSQGAGLFGCGILVDAAGDDSYTGSGNRVQGAGSFGVGILVDYAGNDTYSCDSFGQAAGEYGVGILLDGGGDDRFDIYSCGQGFGSTLGAGLLVSCSGNDTYIANDSDIRYPSSQSDQHNCSLVQGAASGQRRDYVDGCDMAGGVGMLMDFNGNDRYFGGVFSQAVGFLYGVGILDDRQGDDHYRGVWYAQSATAHFSVSLLLEGGGDDSYVTEMYNHNATPNDFSISLFIEEGGNDSYRGQNGFGTSYSNSLGICLDLAGDDTYNLAFSRFASIANDSRPGTSRGDIPTRGLFLDVAGKDTYAGKDIENGRYEEVREKAGAAIKRGVRYDRE